MSDNGIGPIGGYFEFELRNRRRFPYFDTARFQSARSAFLALVRAGRPARVWIPRFICDAMLAPLVQEGIECIWYDVDDRLAVAESASIGVHDWLLYVNYFGVCDANVAELIRRFAPDQVVLDYSQAFFSPPRMEAVATIYSPRKFFGVPDGGLLASRIPVSLPEEQDRGSFSRVSHLMRRLGDTPEAGYADYRRAEESLTDLEPRRMSRLTERILSSIDFDNASRKRRENFMFLHEMLGGENMFAANIAQYTAPLCYPFMTADAGLRDRLINHRIYVASYWPDSIGRVSHDWAVRMVRNLLPLPIDQRYGRKEMRRLASVILGASE